MFSQRVFLAFGGGVLSVYSWRFLIWLGLSVPVPCYSAWDSAVTVSAMVVARASAVGVLGLCEKSHACIAARERATCSCCSDSGRVGFGRLGGGLARGVMLWTRLSCAGSG